MSEEKKSFLSQRWVLVAIVGTFLLGSVMIITCCGGIGLMNARHAHTLKKSELEAEQRVESLKKNDYDHFWNDGLVSPKKPEDIPLSNIEQQLPLTIQDDGNGGPVEIRKSDSSIRELKTSKPGIPPAPRLEKIAPGSSPVPAPKKS